MVALYSELSFAEKELFDLSIGHAVKAEFKTNDNRSIPILCVPNVGSIGLIERGKVTTRDFVAKIDIPYSTYKEKIGSIETEEKIFINDSGETWRVLSVDSIDELSVVLNCMRKNLKAITAK